jgi:hypothetical protein
MSKIKLLAYYFGVKETARELVDFTHNPHITSLRVRHSNDAPVPNDQITSKSHSNHGFCSVTRRQIVSEHEQIRLRSNRICFPVSWCTSALDFMYGTNHSQHDAMINGSRKERALKGVS